jgi:ABC-type transport system involved in multi-copper enzyme maturation permease subunit
MRTFDLAPVFWSEWRRVSRDRWSYILRSILVTSLLAALAAVFGATVYRVELVQASTIADARVWCFVIVVLTQLSMVLLVAPVSSAGAFSTEMARGHVFLMMVTGLTGAEIVFGTLAARILAVLSSVACVLPVLLFSGHITGIPMQAILRLEIVTLASALLGCTLALALSVRARSFHETLLATYVILALWVLGAPILFMIGLTSVRRVLPGPLAGWLQSVNPYWLVLGPILRPGFIRPRDLSSFSTGSIALSLVLAAVAAWRLTSATATTVPARGPKAWRWVSLLGRVVGPRPLVSLDAHPVFWRECRLLQPSRPTGLLWRLYVMGAVFFTALAVFECATRGPQQTIWAGLFNGFQAAVGLLLLSVVTPAALAEDRARGGLELLLATPISTRNLVLSKWCAYYRAVPALALLPALIAAAHAPVHDRWPGVFLAAGLVMAQGAAVTSLGIALATWCPRVDRALILSAAVAVVVTVAWVPLTLAIFQGKDLSLGVASASPFFGVAILTTEMAHATQSDWPVRAAWACFWIVTFAMIAVGLLWATLKSFDRCLGRIPSASP